MAFRCCYQRYSVLHGRMLLPAERMQQQLSTVCGCNVGNLFLEGQVRHKFLFTKKRPAKRPATGARATLEVREKKVKEAPWPPMQVAAMQERVSELESSIGNDDQKVCQKIQCLCGIWHWFLLLLNSNYNCMHERLWHLFCAVV